ncbi:uncharacterized protein Smg (DUF494 family) [Croceifilum oryzae]|uniref:Uncharacterized protein Smg (DUF494 family) n=1 Tax=Croceifilum oryzae TaxID=1553429 RepID=A0AAJ1WRK9_9BACL|nr:hypothetical protein [Croceifilum oryzae]MDQ0416098.1 uncharacterized protein Smg (DUF494 family) [Croceifilum oryzae]
MLQLNISGQSPEIQAFVSYLKEQALFDVQKEEMVHEAVDSTDTEIIKLDVATNLLKPTVRKMVIVKLTTVQGKEFDIALLDSMSFKSGDLTIVRGKNYDIFAG